MSSSKYSWLQMPWIACEVAVRVDHEHLVGAVDPDHLHRRRRGPRRRRAGRSVSRGGGRLAASRRRCPASHFASSSVAQAILRVGQRDARDDRLEEAEDDELARLVGRDARGSRGRRAGSRRSGRRSWQCAARRQSGWSISRRGIATERAAFERFIPNSPRKLSVPTAVFSIDDQALHVASGPRRAARPSTAGCRSCRGRRGGCTRSGRRAGRSPPKTISTCSTELRSPASRLSTRLRTSRAPSWASAQWSVAPSPMTAVAVLERDGRGRAAPGGSRRSSRASRPRWTSSVPAKSDWAGRRARLGPDAHELLDERRRGALAELDDRPGQEGPIRARRRPSGGRSAASRRTPAGTCEDDALGPGRAGQLGELVVGGQRRRRPRGARGRASRVAATSAAERLERSRRPRRGLGGERDGRRRRPRRTRASAGDVVRERGGRPPDGVGRRGSYGADVRRASRRAGRRTVVYSGSSRPAAPRTRSSARAPVGARASPARRSAASASTNASVEARRGGRSAPRRTGPGGAIGVAGGDLRHPSDPSISSFTRRLNSMAYSIGSSLVKTSRKPWTMRFWSPRSRSGRGSSGRRPGPR